MVNYEPKQGDIILINLNPKKGHEQSGFRPALVVSNKNYSKYTKGFALVCPITNKIRIFPLNIPLSDTTTTGMILCQHLRSIDLEERFVKYIESVSDDIIKIVLNRIKACMDFTD